MRSTLNNLIFGVIVASILFVIPVSTVLGKSFSLITKEELKSIMNGADVVIVDIRSGRDWSSNEFKIQGAVHGDPKQVAKWKRNYSKDKKIVLYCA